ncbi:PA domain-containing protein [Pleurostoma richardsiae]|uniref:PA domain-containing protein n=1 Tax=Pleurostoma richardsiae TaxID=41990 RepID=A0AA38VL39_9PEZI|nr:PA domain-containing protein [Pleurostoma richardsiae]
MPPDEKNTYDPVPPIPSYDEAVAGASRTAFEGDWQQERDHLALSPVDDRHHSELESEGLLNARGAPGAMNAAHPNRPRRAGGYRPPTVHTDDEDSNWDSESDDDPDEAAHVRREMQELEMIDPADGDRARNSSIWGKRMPFSLSLPQWKWSWRPRLPRFRIRLGADSETAGGDADTPRRRWCNPLTSPAAFIVVGRLLALFLVLGFLYLLFVSDLFSNMTRRLGSQMFDPESVRIHVQSSVDGQRIRENLRHFTNYAHIAGTEGDYGLALDVKDMFLEYGLEDVVVDEYYVYLNYPKADGRAVEILGEDGKPTWTAKLEEPEVGGETAGHQTYVFHGHSKSGDVKGPLIYANYGSREDFKRLQDNGIDTKGAIALVRYYGSQGDRALKVKAAELAGFAGCIIYSDPADDGFVKGDVAPNGRYMPADGVQRGAVSLMSWVVGDVLTPGWESKKGLPRLAKEKSAGLVGIPSLPLAWRDAQVLLQHVKGFGEPCPDGWTGGVPDIGEWWTGNLSSPLVRLKNEQDEIDDQPIWNVYGRIVGVEQTAKTILIGNHRDAWTFGATDPGSGTAVMMEIARIFGDLLQRGWRPLRTIEFMSWDAEEYNLIGSTEYVEKNLDGLRKDAYAYINLDTAVAGSEFRAAGSPVFNKLLYRILDRVSDPNFNTTLRDLWDRRGATLEGLGAGSDYVAFQDIAGTSSLDLVFEGPPFPYHSSYDNFEWMDRVGDPGFVYHTMLGQLLGLLILELADRPILPFDMSAYAGSLGKWVDELRGWAESKGANQNGNTPLNFTDLKAAADDVAVAAKEFEAWELTWENRVLAASGWEPLGLGSQRCDYNDRMAAFETDLLDLAQDGGIPNRTQFRHVVFGPQLWSGYDEAFFPAIRDVIDAGDWVLANETVYKVASIIRTAAKNLVI